MFQPEKLSVRELLQCYVDTIAELKIRKIVRTGNNPTGDYAEWLVAKKLNLTLETNSKAGYDAVDAQGTRYQIGSLVSQGVDNKSKPSGISIVPNFVWTPPVGRYRQAN